MKKKIFGIALILILLLTATIVPLTSVGADTYDASLILENKDASWVIKADTIGGLLEYDISGTSFDFTLTATGLPTNTEYSLIYYTDTEDRYVDWGGADGIVIANFVTDGAGTIDSGAMSVFLGTSMPNGIDANAYFHDYTQAPDFYVHTTGAKIWLVPTSVLTAGNMPVATWSPDDTWLFETDLITYEQWVSETVGFDGDVINPMLTLALSGEPDIWYNTATYTITIDATNPTDAAIGGVYGKITEWDTTAFKIVYVAARDAQPGNPNGGVLGIDPFCGFWNVDESAYYFGPSDTNGDTYDAGEAQSFVFEVTPLKAGAFDIGIVLVAGIVDPREIE